MGASDECYRQILENHCPSIVTERPRTLYTDRFWKCSALVSLLCYTFLERALVYSLYKVTVWRTFPNVCLARMCAWPNSLRCRAYSEKKLPCPTVLVPYRFTLTSLNSSCLYITHTNFTQRIPCPTVWCRTNSAASRA